MLNHEAKTWAVWGHAFRCTHVIHLFSLYTDEYDSLVCPHRKMIFPGRSEVRFRCRTILEMLDLMSRPKTFQYMMTNMRALARRSVVEGRSQCLKASDPSLSCYAHNNDNNGRFIHQNSSLVARKTCWHCTCHLKSTLNMNILIFASYHACLKSTI